MTKMTRIPSFGNVDEWLQAFEYESSPQMRRGMLEAIFFKNNFVDSKGLTTSKQVTYVLRALELGKNSEITICRGVELVIENVLKRNRFNNWPRGVSKESVIKIFKFVERCSTLPVDPVHFRQDILKNFFTTILSNFAPQDNTAAQNSLVIRTVIACGHIKLLAGYFYWKGHPQVIKEILKYFPKNGNPFKGDWRTFYSEALAIHLAHAGELDEVIDRLYNRYKKPLS